jgi:hypothetical protein
MRIKGTEVKVGDRVYVRAVGYARGDVARVLELGSTPDSTHFFEIEGLDRMYDTGTFALREDQIAELGRFKEWKEN